MTEDNKSIAKSRIADLIKRFNKNKDDYLRPVYNETQTRTDFITPLIAAFGWDVYNTTEKPLGLREVIEEATVEVGEERLSKKPDYELRLVRQRKLFVEAKKPSVHINKNKETAFQTRRYGFSASLPIAILTNFYQLAVYDCKPKPNSHDEAHVARILFLRYDEFLDHFDDLWELLSHETVYSGAFDQRFSVDVTRHGAEQFDDFFLNQVRSWRERLAKDISKNTPGITSDELTYVVQIFLLRIIFLRICEDREIERYETLRDLASRGNCFDELIAALRRADDFYNSGLFHLLDDGRLGARISNDVLSGIIDELYYPHSPYTFAVVEAEMLGEIYEQFLGEFISINTYGNVEISIKPEVRESGGVVPTPRFIVDSIAKRTLGQRLTGKSPTDLAEFTIADICCGSGIFLLSAYDFLTEHYLSWYTNNNPEIYENQQVCLTANGQWRLTLHEKRRILLTHIRGVDIDPNAVEVAKFSLLLKLIEQESSDELRDFVRIQSKSALPELDDIIKVGNSLVSRSEWDSTQRKLPSRLLTKINPFSWPDEFPADFIRGGFDIIVGNPPYVRIQNMKKYSPEEASFYKDKASPYTTAHRDNFDKYSLFIERSLSLTRANGRLGFIIPHKFMTIQAGRALRQLITTGKTLSEIVHFGTQQVFGRLAMNYTCLLILDRAGSQNVIVERVKSLSEWRYGKSGHREDHSSGDITDDPWNLADEDMRLLIARVKSACNRKLINAAEIFVGLQTSADSIYMFSSTTETSESVSLEWNGRTWLIEKAILRPCLQDAKLHPFEQAKANTWMIFPYKIAAGNPATARLYSPEEMLLQFPVCYSYLLARRASLMNRHVSGKLTDKNFYQFGRSQSLAKFKGPKIILPIMSREARYAYDESDIVMTGGGNGPYYLIRPLPGAPECLHFLLAVLHHPLCEAIVRTKTSSFRGGYYSHGKQFIKDLPIPTATPEQRIEIQSLVMQLIESNMHVGTARIPHDKIRHQRNSDEIRKKVEQYISNLFGLSEEDIATAKAVPTPS